MVPEAFSVSFALRIQSRIALALASDWLVIGAISPAVSPEGLVSRGFRTPGGVLFCVETVVGFFVAADVFPFVVGEVFTPSVLSVVSDAEPADADDVPDALPAVLVSRGELAVPEELSRLSGGREQPAISRPPQMNKADSSEHKRRIANSFPGFTPQYRPCRYFE